MNETNETAKKDRIVIMGSAPCLEVDMHVLFLLGGIGPEAWDFLAVGLDCADRWLGRIEHAVSYHPNEFPEFRERRAKAGGNLDYVKHTHNDPNNCADRLWPYFSPSGSSSMLGVEVAVGLGYKKIVVCGCPLQDKGYVRFQEGWKVRLDKIKDVTRAMSGFPLELLGLPTEEWLNE